MRGFGRGDSWQTKFGFSLATVNNQKVNIYKDIRGLVLFVTVTDVGRFVESSRHPNFPLVK